MGQPYYYAVGTSRGRLPAVPLAGAKPERYIFLSRIAAVHVGQVIVGVLRPYRNLSRIGVRDLLSYQSLTPAAAGISRYEKLGRRLVEEFEGHCRHPRLPWIPASAGMTNSVA